MIDLSPNEIRVLGVLFEKERTTPDQYPLSLNALTNGCNQKSNREPVLTLEEAQVQEAIDSLTKHHLIAEVTMNGRVSKYRQRFSNTEFGYFEFSRKELSLLCVLFLRGPQTPGELRTRTNRLCEFSDVQDVEQVLQGLEEKDEPCIRKLPREPGKRESRYVHLFSGDVQVEASSQTGPEVSTGSMITPASVNHTVVSEAASPEQEARMTALEQQVQSMQQEIDALKALWDELND